LLQRGSAATELVLVTPVIILLVMFVVFLGRITTTQAELQDAAHSAARAASLARTPSDAITAASQMADAALGSQRITCSPLAVTVDTSAFRPGGAVSVTVTCSVNLADLGALHVPGAEKLSTSFTEPIDRFEGLR
jgi:Flp pilus assembly protein TadG